MKKTVLFCFGILLLSCGEKVVEKPENLIPKEKMVDIFYDLALLNAAEKNIKTILEHKEITIMGYLYEKHGIDSLQLAESDLYYASVPLEYQAIYEEVDAILKRRKNALEGASKKRNDSVRKAQQKKREEKNAPKTAKKTIKED